MFTLPDQVFEKADYFDKRSNPAAEKLLTDMLLPAMMSAQQQASFAEQYEIKDQMPNVQRNFDRYVARLTSTLKPIQDHIKYGGEAGYQGSGEQLVYIKVSILRLCCRTATCHSHSAPQADRPYSLSCCLASPT